MMGFRPKGREDWCLEMKAEGTLSIIERGV